MIKYERHPNGTECKCLIAKNFRCKFYFRSAELFLEYHHSSRSHLKLRLAACRKESICRISILWQRQGIQGLCYDLVWNQGHLDLSSCSRLRVRWAVDFGRRCRHGRHGGARLRHSLPSANASFGCLVLLPHNLQNQGVYWRKRQWKSGSYRHSNQTT